MTPQVKRAYDEMMEWYDKVMAHLRAGRDVGHESHTVAMFHHKAIVYASELYCPARKPAALADKDASDYAIAQCHDLVAMMRTWKPIYA